MLITKNSFITVAASLVYVLRRRSIVKSSNTWIVVTGCVGKTITRQTLARALREAGQLVVSPNTSYVNEMGILCTLFQVTHFSMWSPSAWWQLLTNVPLRDTYVCIELGADFRTDIDWFLNRFTPYAAIITPSTTYDWTGVVPDVVAARARLEARAAYVLRADTFSSAATDSVYAVPIDMAKVFLEHERISVPTQITPFTEGRWGMREIAQSYIAFDTYKVTPYCLTHALRAVLWHNSARKIFIMTEIRPRLITTEALYAPVLEQLARIDEVYYIGDPEVGAYLQSLCAVTQVSVSEVPTLKQSLQARIAAGEALSIGIKTAQYYRLSTLSDW